MSKRITGVYAITDENLIAPKKFKSSVIAALEGGAKVIQYRNKSKQHELRWQQAKIVVDECKNFGAISIINDDIELAKIVNADGVHIGIEDDSLEVARQELGDNKIIGVSCYADLARAKQAATDSANYVAFGSIFDSPTKPQAKVAGTQVLEQAKQVLDIPIVAIGGVTPDNMPELMATKVDSVAIISGIFAQENITMATKTFSNYF
jgi:thiamine-phosphate pyrophosphorylase